MFFEYSVHCDAASFSTLVCGARRDFIKDFAVFLCLSELKCRVICEACKIYITAQKRKFSIKDFFSKCDQIRKKLRIWLHLLKKSLTDNLIFCAVYLTDKCVFGLSIITHFQ